MEPYDHPISPTGDGWRRRLARLWIAVQDRLWHDDEKWAADRGYRTWRSSSGWAVNVRDPRFGRRHACVACDGTGRHHITGADCADCGGVGVVTDPEWGEPG